MVGGAALNAAYDKLAQYIEAGIDPGQMKTSLATYLQTIDKDLDAAGATLLADNLVQLGGTLARETGRVALLRGLGRGTNLLGNRTAAPRVRGEGIMERSITGLKALPQGIRKFSKNEAIEHFSKHGNKIKEVLGKQSYSVTDYLNDANHVIKNGTWVPELNGYVKLVGGAGKAKYVFVGVNKSTGNLTTFHIKYAEDLAKAAPSLGIK